ncbi:hypothetical protein ASG49_06655 [Marmoricola sp. Leaf446]|uniref:glycosyltransferase n=1 Tax=Marmoricola sp. Leaf446 TaxID=1736379 RepID=UPI00070079C2|nr:glycosyltransferase family 2 protein [Marmoricola sp. Leaf446]KQT94535.1 hypothetical protein ASG49_06655 [Marmoricola sp. Leaf446]
MTVADVRPGPLAVHVVVPARDEELLLGGHLVALARAVAGLRRARPAVRVAATLVLDACTDGSADLVRRTAAGWGWLEAVEVELGCVGRARAAGVDRARVVHHDLPPERVWVASTDADSVVPPDWLRHHAQVAADGAALLTGTVRPVGLSAARLDRWHAAHQLGEGHEHVHGANLGFTLAANDAVGGFAPLSTGEDVDLVARLRSTGVPWVASAAAPVLTSGRAVSRAPEGFAEFVADL